jgi:hypothetical protein
MSVTFSDQAVLPLPTAGHPGGASAAELADRVLRDLAAAMELLGERVPEEAGTAPGTVVAG